MSLKSPVIESRLAFASSRKEGSSMSEELVKVEMLKNETNRPVNERIAYLNSLLIDVKSKVTPIEVLLREKFEMEPPAILEN